MISKRDKKVHYRCHYVTSNRGKKCTILDVIIWTIHNDIMWYTSIYLTVYDISTGIFTQW